ncbi:prepilin peptidase [Anaerosalibacter sp. Marseille-P3206]|uniref:prepilin peptidase n=1 Tax=Anaerosalibacter sp. Marseille-P3206 TaxID=1871005 RepID=UPI00098796E0|nr:A24 family peptidase [Anaerosalibacter sp. Marseille-P3206]
MSILIFIIGTIIGSFLNVCIYRIPRKKSVVFPSSHCTSCGTPLKWYNLIPIFSYIYQRAKCSYCGEKISLQYPTVELLNGFIYLLLYYSFGLSIDFIFYSIIFSILLVISFIDFKFQIIPDSLNILILIFAIIFKILQYTLYDISPNIFNSILGLIISGGLFLLIAILSKGGMGGGDIKLIGVLGFILGIKFSLLNIFLSFILGAIISIFLLLFKIKGRKDPIPFGPFICIAFMIVTICGENIIFWYLNNI